MPSVRLCDLNDLSSRVGSLYSSHLLSDVVFVLDAGSAASTAAGAGATNNSSTSINGGGGSTGAGSSSMGGPSMAGDEGRAARREVYGHKAILAASSPYFMAMFAGHFCEAAVSSSLDAAVVSPTQSPPTSPPTSQHHHHHHHHHHHGANGVQQAPTMTPSLSSSPSTAPTNNATAPSTLASGLEGAAWSTTPTSVKDGRQVVQLPGVSHSAFTVVMKYIYFGQVKVPTNQAMEVLAVSEMMQLPKLKAHCEQVISASLSTEYVCVLWEEAKRYNAKLLAHQCWQFIVDHADQVLDAEFRADADGEVTGISGLTRESLLELIRCDDLQVTDELKVFEAVVRWGRYQCMLQSAGAANGSVLLAPSLPSAAAPSFTTSTTVSSTVPSASASASLATADAAASNVVAAFGSGTGSTSSKPALSSITTATDTAGASVESTTSSSSSSTTTTTSSSNNTTSASSSARTVRTSAKDKTTRSRDKDAGGSGSSSSSSSSSNKLTRRQGQERVLHRNESSSIIALSMASVSREALRAMVDGLVNEVRLALVQPQQLHDRVWPLGVVSEALMLETLWHHCGVDNLSSPLSRPRRRINKWSNERHSVHISLLENNTIACKTAGTRYHTAMGPELTRDRSYWEVLIEASTDAYIMVGVCDESIDTQAPDAFQRNGAWMYFGCNGQKWRAGRDSAYSETFQQGDRIGVLVENSVLSFFKNGVWLGEAFTDLPPSSSLRPAVLMYTNNDRVRIVPAVLPLQYR